MANTIKIKNSGTASNVPSANSLSYGELAINYNDGKLFYKDSSNAVITVNLLSVGGATSLDGLTDVVITSPAEFQGLSYDGASWTNGYIPLVSYVQNAEANTITTGTCVYLFGATGDHATVKRADNNNDSTSSKTIGVVGANIAASQNGPVVTRGYVDGIDLSTGYTAGDILWLGENGAFTKTKPTAPDHLVFIGVVVRATNNGIIYVATQNGYELDEIHNVSLPNPQAGEFLKYNGSLWVSDVIDLGTDTTGNYMSDISGTSPVSVAHTPSEGSSATISLASGYGDTQNPYASKTANYVLAAPNGVAGVPTFRAIVASDIPTLNQNTTGSAATLTTTRTIWGQNFNGSANVTGSLSNVTTIALNGSTSGTTTLQASAIAGATTITFPATTGTVVTTGDTGTVTSTMIANGTIVDADISSAASISVSKLASGTAGQVLMANATGVATYTSLSGDVTINSSGVATIAANSVALGTDTTGDYVSTITAGTGVSTTGASTGENIAHTISIGQSVATNANPTFAGATLDAVQVGITAAGEIDTSTGNLTLDSAGGTVSVDDNLTVSGNATITGNLIVNGTTVTVNSTTMTVDDPIITIGGDTAPSVDDNKDRGVEFRWHNGTAAKVGFFGYDDSSGKLTFIPDATNTSEVFSGTKGTIDANIEWSDVLTKPDPVVTVTLTGDVTGTASATLTDLASNTVTVTTTIAANSVALGTDTTGNYMSDVSGTSPVSVSHTPGEGTTATVSLASAYGDTQNPYGTKTANYVLAGPTTGVAAAPSFRALVAGDIPTLNQNTTGSAAKWTTARTVTLAGDLSGSASIDGSADVTLTATIAANSVALGTDTTGNYVSGVSAGTGISVTHTPAEGSTATVAVDASYAGFAPIGSVVMWSGSSAPTGWAICDGAQLLISSYTALYNIIGTRYGALTNGAGAVGSTHFRLPSFSQKLPKGLTSGIPAGTGTPSIANTTIATGVSSAVDVHTHGVNSSLTAGNVNSSFSAGNAAAHTHSISGNTTNESTLHHHFWNATVTTANEPGHAHGYFKPNSGANTNTGQSGNHSHNWTANVGTGSQVASDNTFNAYHTHALTNVGNLTGANAAVGNPNTTIGVNSSFTAGSVNSTLTAGNASTINSSTLSHTHSTDALDIVFIIRIS